jgi:hypothetical protein
MQSQAFYQIGASSPWTRIPQDGCMTELTAGQTLHLKAICNQQEDSQCELLDHSDNDAIFLFKWKNPNWPSVTVEAKEAYNAASND